MNGRACRTVVLLNSSCVVWKGCKSTFNGPFPCPLVSLFRSESNWCETILMKMTLISLHGNETACRTHFHKKTFLA